MRKMVGKETSLRAEQQEWVLRAREGDRDAFEKIVVHYQGMISGVLYSGTGDFHQSEDLAQETFCAAWRKLGELRKPEALGAWLRSIARNLMISTIRRRTDRDGDGRGGTEEIAPEPVSESPDPENLLLLAEESRFLWRAVGQIKEPYRETLILYYRNGRSVREIAEMMGVREATVKQRLSRARKSLKSTLEERIGQALSQSAPDSDWTFAVMASVASIPSVGTASIVGGTGSALGSTVGGTGTISGKTALFTGGGKLGLGGIVAIVASLLLQFWLFLFIGWLWFRSVRNAPTLSTRRERAFHLFRLLTIFPIFGFLVGLISFLLWRTPFFQMVDGREWRAPLALLISFLLIFPYVVFWGKRNRSRFRQVLRADLGLIPAGEVRVRTEREVERSFFWGVIANLLPALLYLILIGMATFSLWVSGSILWYHLLFFLFFATIWVLCLITVEIYFGRKMVAACRPEGMTLYPPPADYPVEKALREGGEIDVPCSEGRLIPMIFFFLVGANLLPPLIFGTDWNRHPILTGGILLLGTILIVGRLIAKFLSPNETNRPWWGTRENRKGGLLLLLLLLGLAVLFYKVQFGSWGLIGGSVPTPEWTFYRSVLRKMILSFLVCGSFMFGFTLFRFFQLRGEEKDFDKEKTDHGGTDGE